MKADDVTKGVQCTCGRGSGLHWKTCARLRPPPPAAPGFSPGPWVNGGRYGRLGIEIRSADHQHQIAVVNRQDAIADDFARAHPVATTGPNAKTLVEQAVAASRRWDANVDTAKANAALILTAPDGYALAMAVLETPTNHARLMDLARALIAKAGLR